ncbi:hypothetical protein ACFFON_11590 [Arthrobacter citreus]|uniref:hypothetical protein n=1 Tax=Arthrobacter citreus TaxID=1670 RepID=UPI00337FD26F
MVLVLPAMLLASGCGAGTAESQTTAAADTGEAKMAQLQSELAASHSGAVPELSTSGGGVAGPDAPNQLHLGPLLTGPLEARFVCDTGTASISISGGPRTEIPCGPVEVISGINPYKDGTGISIDVSADSELYWAVEFS